MPEIIAEQRSQAWLDARAGKITASVAAAVLGLDPHRGPFSAWQEIMGHKRQPDNPAMAWGRRNEERARQEYEAVSGNLASTTGFWVHPEYPWLGASPDGLIGADGLVEIKCPGKLPDEVPPANLIQMQVQMMVTGRRWCDYFAWTDNGHWLHRVEPADASLAILDMLQAWHRTYVLGNTPPPRRKPKGAKHAGSAVQNLDP